LFSLPSFRVIPIEILGLEVACIYACRMIKMAKNDGFTISWED
jgi:hypothetical protein